MEEYSEEVFQDKQRREAEKGNRINKALWLLIILNAILILINYLIK